MKQILLKLSLCLVLPADGTSVSCVSKENISFVKYCHLLRRLWYHCRLQQPVQNPVSDNTNILWKRPSLGKNCRYWQSLFFLSFEWKKTGSNSSIVSGIAHVHQKTGKNQ